jgi:hypothetical protein
MYRYPRTPLYLLAMFAIPAIAEVNVNSTPPFTSICVADRATGFNWRAGGWVETRFRPERYTLQKLDFSKLASEQDPRKRPVLCDVPEAHNYPGGVAVVKACYAVYDFGREPLMLADANNCYESYKDGRLEFIQCPSTGNFKPNGYFAKLPSSTSLSVGSEAEKDSMVLSVGTCGVVSH